MDKNNIICDELLESVCGGELDGGGAIYNNGGCKVDPAETSFSPDKSGNGGAIYN